MPKRELRYPKQIEDWLVSWGQQLPRSASLILIGSGGLLWHAYQAGLEIPLPENSMDVDPITNDEIVAEYCYDAMIGSEFELQHGWHVNLMPKEALDLLPEGWKERAVQKKYGNLEVVVPSVVDLIAPKLKRAEPRDLKHVEWARNCGLMK
ncbi:MAG: hypothetical protein K1X66_07750 [Verrucomicrobiae bacterium]|nr:hypothetical protein [Verrucomicrobiae bacterium]